MTVRPGIWQSLIGWIERAGASINSLTRPVSERVGREWIRIKDRILAIPLLNLAIRSLRGMTAADGPHLAAGVAYYALLSLFPLLLGLVALFGLFLPSENIQDDLFNFFQEYLPGSINVLERNINDIIHLRGPTGILSLVLLFWSASTVFGATSRVINRAFSIHDDGMFAKRKLRDLSMALGVGLLVLISVALTSLISILKNAHVEVSSMALDYAARVLGIPVSIAVFLILYKFVPNTKTHWRYVWPGAVLAGVLFEIAKNIFVIYLGQIADYESVYGSLGSVIALIIWLYISAFILMFGAEFSSEYGRMKQEVRDLPNDESPVTGLNAPEIPTD